MASRGMDEAKADSISTRSEGDLLEAETIADDDSVTFIIALEDLYLVLHLLTVPSESPPVVSSSDPSRYLHRRRRQFVFVFVSADLLFRPYSNTAVDLAHGSFNS